MEVRLNLTTQFSLKRSTREKNHAWVSIFCYSLKIWIVDLYVFSMIANYHWSTWEYLLVSKINVGSLFLLPVYSPPETSLQWRASVRFSSGLTDREKGQKRCPGTNLALQSGETWVWASPGASVIRTCMSIERGQAFSVPRDKSIATRQALPHSCLDPPGTLWVAGRTWWCSYHHGTRESVDC